MRRNRDDGLVKRGALWSAWVLQADGSRRLQATGCSDPAAARLRARELERRAANPAAQAASARSIDDAFRSLIVELRRRGRSEATLSIARQKAGAFVAAWGGSLPLAAVTAERVSDYIAAREASGRKPTTVKRELLTLQAALKVAKHLGWLDVDVAAVMPLHYSDRYRPVERWLPRSEVDALIAELMPHVTDAGREVGDYSHAACVAFIVATSARLSEALSARREDIDLAHGSVRLRGTKTAGAARIVPVTSLSRPYLELAMRYAPGAAGEPLFDRWPLVHQSLRRACARAGLERCSPNDLRRSCAMWLRDEGVEPHLIARVLGHVDSTMVERVYGRGTSDALASQIRRKTDVGCLSNTHQTRRNQVDQPEHETPVFSAPPARVERATNALGKRCSCSDSQVKTSHLSDVLHDAVGYLYDDVDEAGALDVLTQCLYAWQAEVGAC